MKPIDISKFQKTLSKSMSNISFGFKDPSTWIHTGNYALNYRVSGDFKKGFPLEGKMTLLAGESGSGKSFVASGNIAKWCQDHEVLPIIIDTENALDESWMRNFGIDPNGYIMKISANLIDDIAKVMSDFIKDYKSNYSSIPYDERPKVLFIIDSLGMATTNVEVEQVEKGDIKGDLGRKQKQLYSLCRTFMASCATEPIGLLATAHVYASQDMFNPDAKISGGCLVAGSKVRLSDGTLKNIEEMKIGDTVYTILGEQEVTNTFHYNKDTVSLTFEDGYYIETSLEHKFLVFDDGNMIWKSSQELKEGDEIIVL